MLALAIPGEDPSHRLLPCLVSLPSELQEAMAGGSGCLRLHGEERHGHLCPFVIEAPPSTSATTRTLGISEYCLRRSQALALQECNAGGYEHRLKAVFLGSNPSSAVYKVGDFGKGVYPLSASVSPFVMGRP